jgi:hypothetical protein
MQVGISGGFAGVSTGTHQALCQFSTPDRQECQTVGRAVSGSPLAEPGVGPGDVPTDYHRGMSATHDARRAGERTRFAAIAVINTDDWSAGNGG